MSRSKLLTIAILLGMLGSLQIVASPMGMAMSDSHSSIVADYEVHDPIAILSDGGFVSQGWPGSGTPEDPYRIEGLSINGGGGPCIRVEDTRVHFLIRDCFFYAAESHVLWGGVHLTNVSYGQLVNNTCTQNEYGIYLLESSNNSLSDNRCSMNTRGIYLRSSDNNSLTGNNCSDNGAGIHALDSDELSILNNTCNQNSVHGIYGYGYDDYFRDCIIANNTCEGNGWSGIELHGCAFGVVTNNICEDNGEHGIMLHECTSDVVTNNICSGNSIGVSVFSSVLTTVTENVIVENSDGIDLAGSTDVSVTWNALIDNERSVPYGTAANFFDYNYWSDYTGVDEDGDGIGDTPYVNMNVVDNHPLMYPLGSDPLLGSPDDIEYEESTIGHSISWFLSILNPSTYRVYRNGSLVVDSGVWSGPITVSVDGLTLGTHNYTLVIFDTNGNSANDTVFVTVVEPVSPIIDSPDDIQYESGTAGNIITWSPSDLNPESYEILRNGTQIDSGSWGGSDIEISIDGLDLGTHNFTLVVFDAGGNNVWDTVMVSVVDTINPVVNSLEDTQFTVGDTGHNLTWILQDTNPFNYEVVMDSIVIASGSWNSTGETVTIILDNMTAGTHFITITITDLAGNEASDVVIVSILPESTTTTDPQFQIMDVLGFGIGFGVLLLAIVFVVLRKRE